MILIFLLFSLFATAKETICLNMVVKDEAYDIKRCLDSVRPLIDSWVIVDVGSSDGTQEIIRNLLEDIPGTLYERPWRNFGANRTEALQLAAGKGDYILFMNGSDALEFESGFSLPPLTKDFYFLWQGTKDFSYLLPQLVKATLPLKWVGVAHEHLECEVEHTSETLQKVRAVQAVSDADSDLRRIWKNVRLLEDGLKKEPNNTRYAFYLSESYRDVGERGKALECYQRRIKMGGWEEEVFWSLLQVAFLLQSLELPLSMAIVGYTQAHRFRPHRIEPIYYLAEIYNNEKKYAQAYELLKSRDSIAKPPEKDVLFNQDWIEKYGLLFQLSISSYYVGKYQESLNACDKLLAMRDLPEFFRKKTEENRPFPLMKIHK
jgi:glycosyltransferase involved in cell wall biosynthesis